MRIVQMKHIFSHTVLKPCSWHRQILYHQCTAEFWLFIVKIQLVMLYCRQQLISCL